MPDRKMRANVPSTIRSSRRSNPRSAMGGEDTGEGPRDPLRYGLPRYSGEWRNWQTRWIQVPVSERTWGFKSPLAHQPTKGRSRKSSPPVANVGRPRQLVAGQVLCEQRASLAELPRGVHLGEQVAFDGGSKPSSVRTQYGL